MKISDLTLHKGNAIPLGISRPERGWNFSLFSKHATAVYLAIFTETSSTPLHEIPMNQTGEFWHVHIDDLPEGLCYSYRLEGPYDRVAGHLFNEKAYLLDPYSKRVLTAPKWGANHYFPNPPLEGERVFPPRAWIDEEIPFDWKGDAPLNTPFEELIIYEMHVRGFTQDTSSSTKHPGTYLGIIEKIDHLKALGINAIELMPVFEFDENHHPQSQLKNFWGYSTINFFTPMNRYANQESLSEFKEMVLALHKAGIEVILDVVYNHTSEGNENGPYQSFKGIDNSSYYLLNNEGYFLNYTGCGNTLKCHHPMVRQLILDSLRYWATEMHVDGFRFDLASILTRDETGTPLEKPPLIEMIANDPVLQSRKLIAEPWDPSGLYQVGSFPSDGKFAEWNGKYRDNVRNFIKGEASAIEEFKTRICGSEDLYGKDRNPYHSINFITAHDGFTLRDLVSYEIKRNEANLEENRDGSDYNANWNCGAEGATDSEEIIDLRQKQMKNFLLALFLSHGTPMLLMGDEYGHTKEGNNNTWCQDNVLNYFLWNELKKNRSFFTFTQKVIALRKSVPELQSSSFYTSDNITWESTDIIAFTLHSTHPLFVAFNPKRESTTLLLPKPKEGYNWVRLIDTKYPAPEDFVTNPSLVEESYSLQPYSAIVCKAQDSSCGT